jgi:hypothetical protein
MYGLPDGSDDAGGGGACGAALGDGPGAGADVTGGRGLFRAAAFNVALRNRSSKSHHGL